MLKCCCVEAVVLKVGILVVVDVLKCCLSFRGVVIVVGVLL